MTAILRHSTTDLEQLDSTGLLAAVRAGDDAAWAQLTKRYVRLLWSVTNSCRLSEHDAQDVIQTTWIRLLENLDRIREPENLRHWLAITARRECWRVSGRAARAPELLGEEIAQTLPADDERVDAALLRREQAEQLWAAVAQLPVTQQRVVRALAAPDEPTYDEIATTLGVPRGSLGPTRHRALRRLRVILEDGESNTCVVRHRRPTVRRARPSGGCVAE